MTTFTAKQAMTGCLAKQVTTNSSAVLAMMA
jgi:hypothetical protein